MNSINSKILLLLLIFGCNSAVKHQPSPKVLMIKESKKSEKVPNPKGLRHFMDGQLLMSQGDYAMAIIEFQQSLSFDPDVGAIHTAIAECYWNLGKTKLAEKHLLITLQTNPEDKQALQMIADQYILEKNFKAAASPLQKLNKLYPNESKYVIALAELKKIDQDFKGAMKLYLAAYSIDPERLELLEVAGRFAIQIDDEEMAKNIFKKLSEIDFNQSRFLSIYIDLLSRSKSFQEGITFIEELNKKHGDSIDRKAQLALLHYRSGAKDKAVRLFRSLIQNSPENPNYYFSLFDIYMEENNISEATDLGDKLIANFPEEWRGYYSRALVFMNQSNSKAVLELLLPVSETFNTIFPIQYLLGISNNQLKKYVEAEKYFVNALIIKPDSRNVLHSMGILYDEIEQFQKSDKIYLKLISIDSTDAQAFNNYAYSLVERDFELKKALTLAEKAVELEPNNPSYLDTIGWIHFKQNNIKKAKYYIELSLKISEENATVLEHLGDILMKIDKFDEAISLYKRALLLDKSNQRLKDKVSSE